MTGVTSPDTVISPVVQAITYTSFEKVRTLDEGIYSAAFVYNSDNQRARMDVIQSGTNILTRWYAGSSYMKENAGGVIREYTYIGGDAYSAPVAAITQSGTTTYYYLLRDYLGNITHQVNISNAVVAEYNFDAWGRRRSADDWSYTLDANDKALFADRGYTGHETLSWFNLVNMNGRLYDPLVGRFLNADPYVQMPDGTQSYNRYSYCMNNPLRYTDYSGYTWGIFKPFVQAAKWVWNEGLPAIDPMKAFVNVMDWINNETSELSNEMTKIGIPDFGFGGTVNRDGNVNFNGSIMDREVFNTANIDKSNAGPKVSKEIAQVNQDDRKAWYGRSSKNWFDYTIGLTGTITTYVDFGYTINQTLVDIGTPALKFSANTGRVLGSTGYFAAGASTYLDYNDPKVSTNRFSYRTTGTVVGLTVGYLSGYAGVGAIAGGTFWAGEQMYDALDYCKNQYDQFNRDLNNAIRSGWRPGY